MEPLEYVANPSRGPKFRHRIPQALALQFDQLGQLVRVQLAHIPRNVMAEDEAEEVLLTVVQALENTYLVVLKTRRPAYRRQHWDAHPRDFAPRTWPVREVPTDM